MDTSLLLEDLLFLQPGFDGWKWAKMEEEIDPFEEEEEEEEYEDKSGFEYSPDRNRKQY